jgi:hypothetical protein
MNQSKFIIPFIGALLGITIAFFVAYRIITAKTVPAIQNRKWINAVPTVGIVIAVLFLLLQLAYLRPKDRPEPPGPQGWTYFYTNSGQEAAQRLTLVSPPPENVRATLAYGQTLHLWYHGSGSGARYEYKYIRWDPNHATEANIFFNDGTTVPIGFTTSGQSKVIAYFAVTKPVQ